MQAYENDLDDEAGYDDYYSGDEDEYEDEYEEEEERQPPKEELEYLDLRQQLKEKIRKEKGKGSAKAQSSQVRRRKLPYDNFGSFFGPSQPTISSRVIQESKSLLENELRTAKMPNSSQIKKRPVSMSGSGAAKNVSHEKRPKVVNEVRRKVETLKDTRDYSFLFSDEAELPVPKKETLSRSGSYPSSEARSAQLSAKPKPSSGINGRTANGPSREERRPVSANGHSRPSSSGSQMNHPKPSSSGSQMQNSRPSSSGSQMQNSRSAPSSSQMQSRSVSGRPASSGSQMQNSRPASSGSQMHQRAAPSSSQQRPGSSTNRQAPMRPPGSTMNGHSSANRNGHPNSRSDPQRSAPAKVPVDHRKQMSSNNGVGPGRSASSVRPLPSKTSLERKPSISAGKSSLQSAQRPTSSRPMSSDPRQRVVEQRKVSRDPATSRMIPKQSAPTSKHQMMSKPGLKRHSPHDRDDDRRRLKKKKPARNSEDDIAFNMLREMFPKSRYAGRDDDDINMEANFEDIQKEERRSARIAREEDEREALLLAEEEKRERMRKSRKMSR
ncbi:hypothetical protein V5N11_002593 [Cardamine amara subsp. amara]|uniref:SPT2 chromatin protein n=1 Tax=Cardamine amara subsp. amara TaxID=228776 RepID=A0ABD1BFJ2_CARAN